MGLADLQIDGRLNLFLAKREIPIIGEDITGSLQELFTTTLIQLQTISTDAITIFIDSPGGNAMAGRQMENAVVNSKAPVTGIVVGVAYSSAFFLLQHCHKRLAYRDARLMCHGIDLSSVRIDDPKLQERIRETRSIHGRHLRYFAKRSHQPLAKWKKWSSEEVKMYAPQALKAGWLDKILNKKLPGI